MTSIIKKIADDDCDFENKKTCGWQLVPAHDNGPSWQWSDGQSYLADHTTNTVEGHMLLANNNFNSSASNRAITHSPLLMSYGTGCVRQVLSCDCNNIVKNVLKD